MISFLSLGLCLSIKKILNENNFFTVFVWCKILFKLRTKRCLLCIVSKRTSHSGKGKKNTQYSPEKETPNTNWNI